jgi:hypothetical protein
VRMGVPLSDGPPMLVKARRGGEYTIGFPGTIPVRK